MRTQSCTHFLRIDFLIFMCYNLNTRNNCVFTQNNREAYYAVLDDLPDIAPDRLEEFKKEATRQTYFTESSATSETSESST